MNFIKKNNNIREIKLIQEEEGLMLYWGEELWKKGGKWFSVKFLREFASVSSLEGAEAVWGELERKVAKKYALQWLARKRMFVLEVQEKLESLDFSAENVQETLDFCRRMDFFDDENLLEMKIDKELRSGRGGKMALLRYGRWVQKERALSLTEEKKAIVRLLEKKKTTRPIIDWKEKNRVFALLSRRGFGRDSIDLALEEWQESL